MLRTQLRSVVRPVATQRTNLVARRSYESVQNKRSEGKVDYEQIRVQKAVDDYSAEKKAKFEKEHPGEHYPEEDHGHGKTFNPEGFNINAVRLTFVLLIGGSAGLTYWSVWRQQRKAGLW